MKNETWCKLKDELAKLDAQSKFVGGGSQYTPDVAAEVAMGNRALSQTRLGKPTGNIKPIPLFELQKQRMS